MLERTGLERTGLERTGLEQMGPWWMKVNLF
jgi:hypothetical protein